MREYIILIAGAAVLSVLGEMMSPESWKKYIRIITGLIVVSVIVTPIAELKKINLLDGIDFKVSEELTDYSNQWLLDEFTDNVCTDVKDRVKREYGKECEVRINVAVSGENEIEGIERMEVYMNFPPAELKEKLSQMYGIDSSEVILNG